MNIILLTLSIVALIYSVIIFFFTGRIKYFEALVNIPSFFVFLTINFLIILALLDRDIYSLSILIVADALFANYTDFTLIKVSNRKKEKNLRVITWNTLYYYPKNHQEISDYIKSYNADIIILQEIYKKEENIGNVTKRPIFEHINFEGYLKPDYIKSFFPEHKFIASAFDKAIISKYPIELLREKQYDEHFGYILAKTKIKSNDLNIFSVHMPYKPDLTFGFKIKKESFRDINNELDDLKDQNVILAGDFNSTKSSNFIYDLFKKMSETIDERRRGIHNSWHVKLMFWRIDFMFYTRNKKFLCVDSKLFGPDKYSDHKGIVSDFWIQE